MNHIDHHPPASLVRPRLAIVVVNYNSWPDVARLVEALSSSSEVRNGECEVIVVDNASHGPIPPVFEKLPEGIRLINRSSNGGFAAGVNEGWRACRSPWILLLNPDVVAGPELIQQVLDRIDARERCAGPVPAIVGFALKNPDGSPQPSVGVEPGVVRSLLGQLIPRSRRNYQADWRIKPGPVPWVTGACMLVEIALLNELGGMDADFFLYYEEVDLCRRAWLHGREVAFDNAVAVTHVSPLQNREITPKMRVIIRHAKLLYFRKHKSHIEFRLLCAIIRTEAFARSLIAEYRGDSVARRTWQAIGSLARNARQGSMPRGNEVLRIADEATRTRPTPPAPHRSPCAKVIESSREES